MANLLSQNIGSNYKGILNLDSTINTPLDTTLRAVTDGMGTSSPLQLSTTAVGIVGGSLTYSAGTNTFRQFPISYTINTTGGTNTVTGIYLNATETSVTGTTHNLMDLQVGGVSKFRVDNSGNLYTGNYITGASDKYIKLGTDNGVMELQAYSAVNIYHKKVGVPKLLANYNGTAALSLYGQTTNDIQRWYKSDGTTLAAYMDKDGFFSTAGNMSAGSFFGQVYIPNKFFLNSNGWAAFGGETIDSSAVLTLNGTTRGFLPPRMTTTQRDAISSPASGLVIYNTTTSKLNVYTGSAWEAVTSA